MFTNFINKRMLVRSLIFLLKNKEIKNSGKNIGAPKNKNEKQKLI